MLHNRDNAETIPRKMLQHKKTWPTVAHNEESERKGIPMGRNWVIRMFFVC